MSERGLRQSGRAEEIKQELRTQFLSVEFGSPDYLAFCDLFALEEQKYHRNIEIRSLARTLVPKQKLWEESQLRVTETRIALLENEIERRKNTDTNYFHTYDRFEQTIGALRTEVSNKLRIEQPGEIDEGWLRIEVEDTCHDILVNDFRDVLYRFYR